MNIYQTQAEAKVANMLIDPLQSLGYELVRVKMFKGGGTPTLQLMLDKADGLAITVSDCEQASRHVSVLLDLEDPLECQYNLEVSSAGIDRPLTRVKDFIKAVGQRVKLQTSISLAGQRNFIGLLNAADEENIKLHSRNSDEEYTIRYVDINEAKLLIEPNAIMGKAPRKTEKSKKEKKDGRK